MKKILMLALALGMALSIASPAFAGSNTDNEGCGVGSPPRVDFTHNQKLRWNPPFFVNHGGPGRHGFQMWSHDLCVADLTE